jgi:transposase
MYKNDGVVRRYSEDLKLKILTELSAGKYSKKKLGEI